MKNNQVNRSEESKREGRLIPLVMVDDYLRLDEFGQALAQILYRKNRKVLVIPLGQYELAKPSEEKSLSQLLYRLKSINYKEDFGLEEFISPGIMFDKVEPFESLSDLYEFSPKDSYKFLQALAKEKSYDDYLVILSFQQLIGLAKEGGGELLAKSDMFIYFAEASVKTPADLKERISFLSSSLEVEKSQTKCHLLNLSAHRLETKPQSVEVLVNLGESPKQGGRDNINQLSYHEGLIKIMETGLNSEGLQHVALTYPPRPLIREPHPSYVRRQSPPHQIESSSLAGPAREEQGLVHVENKPLTTSKNKEERMRFLYLLSHYSKENKDKYLKDREKKADASKDDLELNQRAFLFRMANSEKILIEGVVFHIGKSRTSANYIVLNNPAISRMHAYIVQKGSSYYVVDNNSTNRTALNGKVLVPYAEAEIHHGDIIQLANENFQFIKADL